MSDDSESGEATDSDSDQEDGLNQLKQFLLDYYRGLTPHVFNSKTNRILDRCDKTLSGISTEKFFERLSYALENVDEFVIFKKFLVTSLHSDRDRIKLFIQEDADLVKLTDFVFRCRRIRFSSDRSKEQIRLIYNF